MKKQTENDKKWVLVVKEKLQGYNAEPSPNLWEKISTQLEQDHQAQRLNRQKKIKLSISVALLILVSILMYWIEKLPETRREYHHAPNKVTVKQLPDLNKVETFNIDSLANANANPNANPNEVLTKPIPAVETRIVPKRKSDSTQLQESLPNTTLPKPHKNVPVKDSLANKIFATIPLIPVEQSNNINLAIQLSQEIATLPSPQTETNQQFSLAKIEEGINLPIHQPNHYFKKAVNWLDKKENLLDEGININLNKTKSIFKKHNHETNS